MDAASLAPDAEGERGSSTGLAWGRAVLLPRAITLWCLSSLLGLRYSLWIEAVTSPSSGA